MPNIYDGTDDELGYGQALVLLASARGIFPNESVQTEIVRAIQREHDLVPPPPDSLIQPLDARDQTLRNQDEELALLRAELDRRNKADAAVENKAGEIAALRAKLSEPVPAADDAESLRAEVARLKAELVGRADVPAPRDAELAARTSP